MRPGYIASLRERTVDMFYHGFENYMRIAFPEDEVGYEISLLASAIGFVVPRSDLSNCPSFDL